MRKKKSNHNLSYYTKSLSGKRISLYVRHKYGTENPSYVKTALVIPESALEKKKKEVKSREGDDSDFRDKFRQIETQRQLLLDKLNNHEI